MPADPRETVTGPESAFERALAAIEAELALVFVSAERVQAACAELRREAGDWRRQEHADRLCRLVPLLQGRTGPFLRPLVVLLRAAARGTPRPWPVVEGLLAGKDPEVCGEALDDALSLADAGSLDVNLEVAQALADLAEREASPLLQPACLEKVARLLQHLAPGAGSRPPAVASLLDADRASLRRLASRILDLAGGTPPPGLASRLLGEADAAALAPYLAYTRAGHLDLVDLVRRPGGPAPVAGAIAALEAACGRALAGQILGELGWRRTNLGLTVQRVAGVSVDDSLPFLLTPAEADVVASCAGARRVFERVVAIGHGGCWEQAGAGSTADHAVTRFRAYNLAHAEVLGDILDVAPLTAEKVHAILRRMDGIAGDFVALFAARSDEAAALPGLYGALKDRILRELASATPGRPLSVELTRLVQMFEDPPTLAKVRTLHGLKRYLHQRGLALGFGLLESGRGTNRTVDIVVASPERVLDSTRRIEYVDFDPEDEASEGPARLPYPVAVVADAFVRQRLHGQISLPLVRIFCYGNEVHYFVSFRNHPVFIRIDYSPPLGGGMIDLAYYGVSKYELDAHPALALDAVQACLRRLDFFVEVDNTRIHARYDKERALDLADLCEKAEALFRLVPYLMDLDWTVGSLDLPEDARRAVGLGWAELFARWGLLPTERLLTADRTGILAGREARPEGVREVRWSGHGPYEDAVSARPRPELPAEIHAALAARGVDVPLVEREREVGQVALERHVLRPLRAALARGELVEDAAGLHASPPELFERQHEADRLAAILGSDAETIARSARLAKLAAALERTLRFRTTGRVNGYEVQRAELVLRGESGTLCALRDAAGIFRLAVYAPGGALYRRRAHAGLPWQDNASCDVSALAARLRRNNFLPSWIDTPPDAGALEARSLRALFAAPNPLEQARPLPGERAVACLRASPGRASGLARLGTRGRRAEDLEGGVLFAATIVPEDQAFLFHAAAIVGTGGGILSHAGLMAVQSGRPALILPGTWREDPDGTSSVLYRRVEFDERERAVAGYRVVERRDLREHEERIREGDLVAVDADEGVLRVLGQGSAALTLHHGLRGLEAARARLARATADLDVLAERGRRLRAVHQLERLFARIDEPALVQHAVRELLVGASAGAGAGGRGEQVHLLRLLLDRPQTRAQATDGLRRVAREMAERSAMAHDEACRLMPTARHAHEVLALRLSALRLRDTLAQVRTLQAGCGVEPAPAVVRDSRAIDASARARLERLQAGLIADLRRAGTSGQGSRRRHVVREAERVADAIGAAEHVRAEIERHRQTLAARDASLARELASRRVLWPADGGLEIEPLAGSKAANLAELHQLGVAAFVPAWFVVTDRAFGEMLTTTAPARPGSPWAPGGAALTLGQAIDAVVQRADADASQKAALIRQLWAEVRLPPALEADIVAAYRQLGDGSGPYVAIRSSAREEDTEAATRAGEFDTFLFIRGADAMLAHLRRAWSGLWTARAIHERAVGGRSGRGEGGGVLVQRIAWSRVAGVLQTINAAEGRTREMVIDVGLGLGEGVVSGRVAADHIIVSKEEDPDREPLRFRYVTADKRERVIFDERTGTGTVRADVLSHQRLRAALEYVELVELVRVATRLEAAYGYPLDIEFGFEDADLRILQVRPVPGSAAVWRDTRQCYPMRTGDRADVGSPPPAVAPVALAGARHDSEARHDST